MNVINIQVDKNNKCIEYDQETKQIEQKVQSHFNEKYFVGEQQRQDITRGISRGDTKGTKSCKLVEVLKCCLKPSANSDNGKNQSKRKASRNHVIKLKEKSEKAT